MVQVMFEHCFDNFSSAIKARLTPTQTELVGFSGEQLIPIRKVELEVKFGGGGLFQRTMLKFTVVRASSPYNIILGHTGMRELGVVSSTIRSMVKFPTPRGIANLVARAAPVYECRWSERQMLRHEEEREVMRLEELEDSKVEKVRMEVPGLHGYLEWDQGKPQEDKGSGRHVVPQNLEGDAKFNKRSSSGRPKGKADTNPICQSDSPRGRAKLRPLEKLALCLLHLFRRLRGYFKAHPIKVITDQPIKQMLNKAKVSRKLAKYAVELEAYNITLVGKENPEEWTLYRDRASSLKGVKAWLVLIDPSSKEHAYAIRLTFPSTNNETEYEALLAGLRIARKMKVKALKVKVDLKLVACQMNGEFVASSEGMAKYLAKAKEHATLFRKFSIENIPKNQKADVLSKLASVAFNHLIKEVLVEVLKVKSMDTQEVNTIVEEEEDNWMTLIIKCLEEEVWPTNENEAKTLRMKISQYTTEEGVLFKKSYLSLMLRCVGPLQANYIIREVHKGACGMHAGARSVVAKNNEAVYYWPTMHQDTKEVVDKCDSC
ncbi:reverse transcriptase domain-containing protein [Tanacetum coccineum]|uniref:Reverse transcriptase domain-containing protein n=1 Tax=Tanacetum coccineum TaxID=301880 RepID=A0ABQ5B2Q8_9ASTR